MTLEQIKDIEVFIRYRMTYNDGFWLLEKLGEDPQKYVPVNMSAEVHDRKDIVDVAKRILAERAIEAGYVCVTNLDYCGYEPDKHLILESSGWERRKDSNK